MAHEHNEQSTGEKQNLARFFIEQQHVAWVSLAVALLWGIYGLLTMPQRKDPDVPVRSAMVIVPWQGTSAEQVEQLVTRKIEQALASNQWVTEIKSASRTGSAMVQFELAEKGKYDRDKELNDVKIRLDAVNDLPKGAGPIQYIKDFGDTSALMLTVASPSADPAEVAWVGKLVEAQIRQVRSGLAAQSPPRRSIVIVVPKSIDSGDVERNLSWAARDMAAQHLCSDVRAFSGAGFTGVDLATNLNTSDLQSAAKKFVNQNLQADEFHPDAWHPAIIEDPPSTTAALQAVAGDKYTYRDLDDFTDTIQRSLKTLPIVSKVERSGVLSEKIFLNFSQQRLAQYKLTPADLSNILAARNLPDSGQTLNARGRTVSITTTGEFKSVDDLRHVIIGTSPNGTPLYLRDVVDIERGYESPASFLNRFTRRNENGEWITTRAITLSVQMRKGEHV
jgi:multidrug efflux pump subunit AcrB